MDNGTGKTSKIVLLFGFLLLGFIFFIFAVTRVYFSDRKMPRLESSWSDTAIRGGIYSSDGFHLANSKKLYKAAINTHNLDPDKKELFVRLFSIYSDVPEKRIKRILKTQNGNVVLSYNLSSKTAKNLKLLAGKFSQMGMFVPYEDKKGNVYHYGLSIVESGEKREYLYNDATTPVIGYIKKFEDDDFTKVAGVKGVERFYEEYLAPQQNGYFRGERDVGSNILVNKNSIMNERFDGYDVFLNISLKLQKKLERIVNESKSSLNAREVLAAVMESETGRIRAIATSNRFNPNRIMQSDYPRLNASVVEYPFEPGSVIKPIVFSLLLEYGLINPYDSINVYNGRYRLKDKVITDTHRESVITNEEVIIISSNIGMAQLAQKLEPINYYKGMVNYGFTVESGIDLPYQRNGTIPQVTQLRDEIYKATVAYGYGMLANFTQLLNAFNVFNNKGYLIEPKIVNSLRDTEGRRFQMPGKEPKSVLSQPTAEKMKQILIRTVTKGTGKKADVEGLEIGGKTGTAHIAEKGKYVDRYNSSFFGFVNDAEKKYTIGVVVFEPDAKGEYFASQTAVPAFRNITKLLLEEQYITRKPPVLTSKQ